MVPACLLAFQPQLRNEIRRVDDDDDDDDDLQMRRGSAVPTSRNHFDVASERTMLSARLVSAF